MVWVWTQTPELPSGASLSVSVSDWSFPDWLNWRTAWYTVMLYGKDWSPMRNWSLWRAVPWLITTAAWQHVYADIYLTFISMLGFNMSVALYTEHGHLSPNLSPCNPESDAQVSIPNNNRVSYLEASGVWMVVKRLHSLSPLKHKAAIHNFHKCNSSIQMAHLLHKDQLTNVYSENYTEHKSNV